MGLCINEVNLRFCPASHMQIRCNPNHTSSKQNQESNYDESKTDGYIQKPWQRVHFIAVYAHPQMELYRLIPACVVHTTSRWRASHPRVLQQPAPSLTGVCFPCRSATSKILPSLQCSTYARSPVGSPNAQTGYRVSLALI